jgi:hypothetical protein
VKRNSNSGLAAALAVLIQNQAAFVAHMREAQEESALIRRKLEQIDARLVRLEQVLAGLLKRSATSDRESD